MAIDNLGRSTRPIVLVGFMAAGKSTIGSLLAERLDRSFIDTDDVIEANFGIPIAEIFRQNGEAAFRDAERNLISKLLEERAQQVIALGGGAFVSEATRHKLNTSATTVWLDPPFELVLSRLRSSAGRPLASGRRESDLMDLWNERKSCYAEAHLRISTSNDPPTITVERILLELSHR